MAQCHTMPILITLFTSTCQEINGKLPISDGAYTESTESSLQRNNYDLSKFLLQVVWDLKVVDPSDPSFPSSNCVETSFGSDGRNTEDRQIASVGEFWRVRFVGWKKQLPKMEDWIQGLNKSCHAIEISSFVIGPTCCNFVVRLFVLHACKSLYYINT